MVDRKSKKDGLSSRRQVTENSRPELLKDNYDSYKCMDAIGNIRKRLEKYEETGNTEFLADIANFAMIEFMYPSIPGAHYKETDSGACETVGFGINELR